MKGSCNPLIYLKFQGAKQVELAGVSDTESRKVNLSTNCVCGCKYLIPSTIQVIFLKLPCLPLLLFQLWDGSSHKWPDLSSQAAQDWHACNHYRALLNTLGTTEVPRPRTELVPNGAHSNTQSILSTVGGALLANYPCTGKRDFDKGHLSAGLASCSRHLSGIEEIGNPLPAILQAPCVILGEPSRLSLPQHANIPSWAQCQDTHVHPKHFQASLTAATWSAVQPNSSGLAACSTGTLSRPASEMEIQFPLTHYTANLPLHHSVLEKEGVSLYST